MKTFFIVFLFFENLVSRQNRIFFDSFFIEDVNLRVRVQTSLVSRIAFGIKDTTTAVSQS